MSVAIRWNDRAIMEKDEHTKVDSEPAFWLIIENQTLQMIQDKFPQWL